MTTGQTWATLAGTTIQWSTTSKKWKTIEARPHRRQVGGREGKEDEGEGEEGE